MLPLGHLRCGPQNQRLDLEGAVAQAIPRSGEPAAGFLQQVGFLDLFERPAPRWER